MLSKDRQQIKDVLDFIVDGGRFRQYEKVGSAPEPQRIANKLESYGALVGVLHGIYGKQWHLTESGGILHGFLISGDIENPALRQDNYPLAQWALLTSGSRLKGRKDAELALLDIALGRSPASADYSEQARRLLIHSGSPQAIVLLRFVAEFNSNINNDEAPRLDVYDSTLKRYSFDANIGSNTQISLNAQDREIFQRVREDMEASGGYMTEQLSNKDIVLILAMTWLTLKGK